MAWYYFRVAIHYYRRASQFDVGIASIDAWFIAGVSYSIGCFDENFRCILDEVAYATSLNIAFTRHIHYLPHTPPGVRSAPLSPRAQSIYYARAFQYADFDASRIASRQPYTSCCYAPCKVWCFVDDEYDDDAFLTLIWFIEMRWGGASLGYLMTRRKDEVAATTTNWRASWRPFMLADMMWVLEYIRTYEILASLSL